MSQKISSLKKSIYGQFMNLIEDDILVEKKFFATKSEADYYGAAHIIAKYCGMKHPLYPNLTDNWQHAWAPEYFNIHPYIVAAGGSCDNKDYRYFVAREDQEIFLKQHGYKNVFSIGLPLVYLDPVKIERKKNSLLVMPVHSLYYTDHGHWGFTKYAEQIFKLKNVFSEIVICIHPACIKNNYWVKEFKAFGFRIIEGASVNDKNALLRIQQIMSRYEYMTTNGYGSHLAYASYFGAKVSIFGDFAKFQKEDFTNDPFYTKYPEILEDRLALSSENTVKKELSYFFVHPSSAIQRIEWAKKQLGETNKLSPEEIYNLFGWTKVLMIRQATTRPIIRFLSKVRPRVVALIPVSIRKFIKNRMKKLKFSK